MAEVSPATLDAIAAFDAAGEDVEIDNEDCSAAEDDLERSAGYGSGEPTEDDEDSDVDEDNGDFEPQCEDEGAQVD